MHVAVMIIAGVMSGDEHALRHFSSGLTGLLERLFPSMHSQQAACFSLWGSGV
jgi:hypothetical protein